MRCLGLGRGTHEDRDRDAAERPMRSALGLNVHVFSGRPHMNASEGGSAGPPAPVCGVQFVLRKPLAARRAAPTIACVTVSLTIISGVLIHFTHPTTYPNTGVGFWWAIQTVTTGGYGDVVPTSALGRIVAALVMIVGIGFLTVITAVITSAFIESARRRLEVARADPLASQLAQIRARLDAIYAKLETAGGANLGALE